MRTSLVGESVGKTCSVCGQQELLQEVGNGLNDPERRRRARPDQIRPGQFHFTTDSQLTATSSNH